MNELDYWKQRTVQLERAGVKLVEELEDYYFDEDDSELVALNDMRRLLGKQAQKPKHLRMEE